MGWILLAVILFIVCAILENAHRNAPEGWEDADGFHYGRKV